MNKRCFKCLCVKPLEQFYKHTMMGDGHLNKCKDCTKRDVATHRVAKIEQIRAYDRRRGSMPHRLAARRGYAQTEAGRASHAKSLKASTLRYPEKYAARNALHNALRDGKLLRWPVCALPECENHPEAHHPDYSRPLEVVWLCPRHHTDAHKLSRELEAA